MRNIESQNPSVLFAPNVTCYRVKHTKENKFKRDDIPGYGEIWALPTGQEIFILGNSIDTDEDREEDGDAPLDGIETIWCANRLTGKRCDPDIATIKRISDDSNTLDELVVSSKRWARDGNHHAAWWLAWWFEGVNHPASTWYYVAVLRMQPNSYKELFVERVIDDTFFGTMCEGVAYPSLEFLESIKEFAENRISRDWLEAINAAEIAVHIPMSDVQVKKAVWHLRKVRKLKFSSSFNPSNGFLLQYGLTKQGLLSSPIFKKWQVNHEKRLQKQRMIEEAAQLKELEQSTNIDSDNEIPF